MLDHLTRLPRQVPFGDSYVKIADRYGLLVSSEHLTIVLIAVEAYARDTGQYTVLGDYSLFRHREGQARPVM